MTEDPVRLQVRGSHQCLVKYESLNNISSQIKMSLQRDRGSAIEQSYPPASFLPTAYAASFSFS